MALFITIINMKRVLYFCAALAVILMVACEEKEETKDNIPPAIGGADSWVNPINCAVYRLGETLHVRYELTDNVELGKYSIEVYNNFQPSNRAAAEVKCQHEPQTATVYPWAFVDNGTIPAGQTKYVLDKTYDIPTDRDEGDYCLKINVSDKAGKQSEKIIEFKIKATLAQ